MSTKTFTPIIDPGTNASTSVQVSTAVAHTRLNCRKFLLKCHTNPVYIRLGPASGSVTSANGYYMAAGDEVRWQTQRGADYIHSIRATGANGVISISRGSAD